MKTALVEKSALGGDCLYHGCVPSKSLLKAATLYRQTRELESYGLPQASIGEVDMRSVNRRVQEVVSEVSKHDAPERFRSYGAEIHFGGSRFLSPHELELEDGQVLSAPKFVLATGSSPKAVPIPGLAEAGYITNREVFDVEELPRRMVVIGAGPIGTEMSQAFARLGSEVTLVDVAAQVLPREDPDMAGVITARLEAEGVQIRTGVSVERVEAEGDGARGEVVVSLDGREERFAADEILLAVGRKANVEGLELENAGVELERGFISTDSKLRTSRKHIYAIGDCNGRYLFTHVASAEASVVVRRVGLKAGGSMSYRSIPWVTYTDPELASVGFNEQRAREAGLEYRVLKQDFGGNDRAHAEGRTEGVMKVLLDRKERVIGSQIAGEHAGELLSPSLYAVSEGWKVGKLMSPVVPYPTLSEINKKVPSELMGGKLFNRRVRGILRMLFRYRGSGGDETHARDKER
jgi:pyruvate/2-oxoglutarate dehydrogenase complex dihydrolipoamide dehydrogenase (E3) component